MEELRAANCAVAKAQFGGLGRAGAVGEDDCARVDRRHCRAARVVLPREGQHVGGALTDSIGGSVLIEHSAGGTVLKPEQHSSFFTLPDCQHT